jgi:hypothetical protein
MKPILGPLSVSFPIPLWFYSQRSIERATFRPWHAPCGKGSFNPANSTYATLCRHVIYDPIDPLICVLG